MLYIQKKILPAIIVVNIFHVLNNRETIRLLLLLLQTAQHNYYNNLTTQN
jgi:hypothetical protein